MFYFNEENSGIHPTAIVHKAAVIGAGVVIGPYSIIGPDVEIGDGCMISAHVVIDGHTVMGKGNRIFNGASIGLEPQDMKYRGEKSSVLIGDCNTIREYVTINRGTEGGGGVTLLGSGSLVMAYTHIAHDCTVGNNVIIANSTNMAGHVVIEDYAVLSGATGIVQYVKIGSMAMTGGVSKISKDLPPYFIADGNPARIRGVNTVGLRRNGAGEEAISALEKAFKLLYHSRLTVKQALQEIEEKYGQHDEILKLIAFINKSSRGIVR